MYKFGKITIICVGSLKEDYLRGAQAEFLKRLGPYGRLTVLELPAENCPQKEGAKILKALASNSYKIALSLDGQAPNSEKFAKTLRNLAINGHSHLEFIIGGSLGLDPRISNICSFSLSLSGLTFTHQLARIILLEQIYRACRILNNQPYHK
ncbi:MAG: 23S rRNA (pseudouridine(1915)-N(3))-methyltransferase RlmH [Clostridiales bacterium]|jgi:23S rRNA (pseudouridine1915-N3)-methyltransferase|nr:23S rRNA (pseudouridine(1915)-N(3))-methyltransferase RlmH [Clostridiales bacterium]